MGLLCILFSFSGEEHVKIYRNVYLKKKVTNFSS